MKAADKCRPARPQGPQRLGCHHADEAVHPVVLHRGYKEPERACAGVLRAAAHPQQFPGVRSHRQRCCERQCFRPARARSGQSGRPVALSVQTPE